MASRVPPRLVLVVADQPELRRALAGEIERARYQVVAAGNGAEALSMIAVMAPIRLVIVDLRVPVMDGYEFLRRFRLLPGCAAVPVYVLTSGSPRPIAGATDVLSKPLKPHALFKLITGHPGPAPSQPRLAGPENRLLERGQDASARARLLRASTASLRAQWDRQIARTSALRSALRAVLA